jgi:hypothetical protein
MMAPKINQVTNVENNSVFPAWNFFVMDNPAKTIAGENEIKKSQIGGDGVKFWLFQIANSGEFTTAKYW